MELYGKFIYRVDNESPHSPIKKHLVMFETEKKGLFLTFSVIIAANKFQLN